MRAEYRIFKGRPEWGLTIPDRPWTVLRLRPDREYGTIGVRRTWAEALELARVDYLAKEW